MNLVSLDRILSKYHRETGDTDTPEDSLIEWIGEAMDFLQVYGTQEQAVAFMEVKDYQTCLPLGFQSVLQIARDNQWAPCVTEETNNTCPCDVVEEAEEIVNTGVPVDCNGKIIGEYDLAYYRPYFDMKYFYNSWTNSSYYRKRFTPVRLSNHTFFNNLVCQEKNDRMIYASCRDEYDIIPGNSGIRFSFKEGLVAIAYLKTALDEETGYPLIPDQISLITAISYYLKWKVSEKDMFSRREGSVTTTQYNQKEWLKYVKQAKNYFKMPKTIDDYQDLLDMSHQMIPRNKRSLGFFGNLTKPQINVRHK